MTLVYFKNHFQLFIQKSLTVFHPPSRRAFPEAKNQTHEYQFSLPT